MTEKTKAKADLQYLRIIAKDMDDSGSAALGEAIREIEEARMEVDELRKDAERYRWLRARNSGPIGIIAYAIEPENEMDLVEDKADAAIDAAMAAKEGA